MGERGRYLCIVVAISTSNNIVTSSYILVGALEFCALSGLLQTLCMNFSLCNIAF